MYTERLINLILLFFSYAFIGWCIEVTLKFIQFHRFIKSSIGTTFVISLLLCGLLEYLTSYFLEKRFHARWWDYSQKPMNLHGRVWIGNLILFGLGGILIVNLVNPLECLCAYKLQIVFLQSMANS